MRKYCNKLLLVLIALVLVWGVIASALAVSVINPKTMADYNRNGKKYYNGQITAENDYLYVEYDEYNPEFVTNYQNQKRRVKYYKILLDKAQEKYDADKSESNKSTLISAKSSYEYEKIEKNTQGKAYLVVFCELFFGTYFLIAVILGAVFMINKKYTCNSKEE